MKGLILSILFLGMMTALLGAGAMARVWSRIWSQDDDGFSKSLSLAIFAIGGAVILFAVLLSGYGSPGQAVFVDFPREAIVTRTAYLLPPGVRKHTIQFGDIATITGSVEGDDQRRVGDYVLTAVTSDGQRVQLAKEKYVRRGSHPPELVALAERIAEASGREVNLTPR